MLRTYFTGLLVASAFVLTDGSPSAAQDTPYSNETAIVFEARGQTPVDAYSGHITVQENRRQVDSRSIRLEYVRFPAHAGATGSPIFYLAGGPGGSGIQTAKGPRFELFMALRAFGDVIAVDQRGTGASNDVDTCTSSQIEPTSEAISDADYLSRQTLALKECLQSWRAQGIDPAGYNTLENVQDLDALRQHFGAEKISLWGISYGSHLALAALKTLDGRIDRVVLASAEGLAQTVKMPARTDAYFARLGKAIGHQDLPGLIRAVHTQLEKEPIQLDLENRSGQAFPFTLQRRDMQSIASFMIADPDRAKTLVGLYEALYLGNTEPVARLLSQFVRPEQPIRFRLMSVAMDIASGTDANRRAEIDAQAATALLGPYLNQPLAFEDIAQDLVLDAEFRIRPVSDVPVLLFSGTLDGRTYVESQIEAVAGLSQLEHIIVEGAGHNLFMWSPEITAKIEAFMAK